MVFESRCLLNQNYVEGALIILYIYYLDKPPLQDPPTHVLIRLAERVLTSNCFAFNNRYFLQKRGVAMGSCLGPSYACLFMSYQEYLIFRSYQGPKRYIDDGIGAANLHRHELMQFINFVCNFHPAIEYTYEISELTTTFLDICLRIDGDAISTSIYILNLLIHTLIYSMVHPILVRVKTPSLMHSC